MKSFRKLINGKGCAASFVLFAFSSMCTGQTMDQDKFRLAGSKMIYQIATTNSDTALNFYKNILFFEFNNYVEIIRYSLLTKFAKIIAFELNILQIKKT